MSGTTPPGARNEEQASRWVREMFGRVAHRYDLANHILSLNIDRRWRARTVERVREVLLRPGSRVLDVCCGTGDLTMALTRARGRPVLGSDFSHPMLIRAARKKIPALFEADALRLPVADRSLDLVTCAFGLRNLANYESGLCELRRVVKPGGQVAILEFSQPPHFVLRKAYRFYSQFVLPRIGGMLSGAPDAYTYLPESVRRFPGAEELADRMRAAGFLDVRFERMTGGVVALHLGWA